MALLWIVYMIVRQNMVGNNGFFPLLISGRKRLAYYFIVGLLEELIFRGLVLGIVLKKIKNIYVRIIASALIFAIPHIFNTDNISIVVMFAFSLLYGVVSGEMFIFTKSIWMSTGFHWLWNYSITSIFFATENQSLVYIWIVIEMFILIPLLYCVFRKSWLSLDEADKAV